MCNAWRAKSDDGEVPAPDKFAKMYPFKGKPSMIERYAKLAHFDLMTMRDGRFYLTEWVKWQSAKDPGAAGRKRRQYLATVTSVTFHTVFSANSTQKCIQIKGNT
jgi:hypothetical protein